MYLRSQEIHLVVVPFFVCSSASDILDLAVTPVLLVDYIVLCSSLSARQYGAFNQ